MQFTILSLVMVTHTSLKNVQSIKRRSTNSKLHVVTTAVEKRDFVSVYTFRVAILQIPILSFPSHSVYFYHGIQRILKRIFTGWAIVVNSIIF